MGYPAYDRHLKRAWNAVPFLLLHARARHPFVKSSLKVLRTERSWSQAKLAGRLNVSRQTVNAIETGKHDPSLPLAFRKARLFGLPVEAIFDDETA